MIIDPFINGFSPNEVIIHLHIHYQSIVKFDIRGLCLVFSNTSHVDIVVRFGKPVVYKVKKDICLKKR